MEGGETERKTDRGREREMDQPISQHDSLITQRCVRVRERQREREREREKEKR